MLQAFRADQQTPIDLSQTISTCERLCFRTVLGKPPQPSVCAFEDGTLTITTPNGQSHDVTPAAGIPCLGGTNPPICNPAVVSITSDFVCYTVREQDVDDSLEILLVTTRYANGTSHSAPNDLLDVVKGGTGLGLGVEECATATDCAPTICDPALSDGVRQGLCTTSDLPLSTPCEADEDPCTIDHCDGNGQCVQHDVIQCEGSSGPCDGGWRCEPTTGECVAEPDAAPSTPCEADGDLCTLDHCSGTGSCVQQSLVTCPDATGFCDGGQRCEPSTGECVDEPDTPASTPCDSDSDRCTVDHCDGAGSCVQQSVVQCTAPDGECDGGQRCEPETGTCVDEPEPPASTPCNTDENLCTVDHCDGNGTCVPQSTVTCPGATPPCEGGQRCEPTTGACVDEPDAAVSTPCEADSSLCTIDHCDGSGSCVQQSVVECAPASPPCEGGALCDPETGECEDQPDGQVSTPCEADTDHCTLDHCDGTGACVYLEDNPALECNRDHYKCYKTRPPRTPPRTVDLVDQFGTTQTNVQRPIRFCNPVDKNNEGIHDTTAHLSCYKIREPTFRPRKVEVTNQFGVQVLEVTRPETLCVPAEKDNVPSPLNVNHFKCYRVVQVRGPQFEERDVLLEDQFETKDTQIIKPIVLCNPVDKNGEGVPDPEGHLTCYKLKDVPGQPDFDPRPVEFEDQFTAEELPTSRRTDCRSSRHLCVPSTKRELNGGTTTTAPPTTTTTGVSTTTTTGQSTTTTTGVSTTTTTGQSTTTTTGAGTTTTTGQSTTTTTGGGTTTTTGQSTTTTTMTGGGTTTTTLLPGTINITVPGQSGTPLVGAARSLGVTVVLTQPAPVGGLNVTLSSDDPLLATIAPATLNIPAGEIVGSATVTGVAEGTTTLRASGGAFSPGALTIQVTNTTITLFLEGAVVGKDLQIGASGSLATAAPAGNLQVTITSADPTRLLLATSATAAGSESITVQVGAGSQSIPTFFVQSLADGDSVEVTASAPGYAPDTRAVTLQPSGFVFCPTFGCFFGLQGDFTTTTFSANTPLTVQSALLDPIFLTFAGVQAVRGGRTVSVPVTSATTAVGTIVGSPAVFNPNDSFVSIAFDPVDVGTTALTVEVPPGFGTPSNGRQVTATVTPPSLSLSGGTTVGRDLQVPVSVFVDAAPPSPTTVTVSVPGVSTATVSADATAAGGSTATFTAQPGSTFVGTVYVQGRGVGDTTLTAEATGYTSASVPVAVQPSGFVFFGCPFFGCGLGGDFTTTALSDNTGLTLASVRLDPTTLAFAELQPVRGGPTVNVPVTSGTTAVGTIVGSPAVFNANEIFNSGVAFDPAGVGMTTLTVGVPAGFQTPSAGRQITATVTGATLSFNFAPLVGRDLQVAVSVFVDAPPPSTTTVTVGVPSGATSIATVATDPALAGGSTVTFTLEPGNTFVGTVYVQGRGLGDTTLTAQATGYGSASVPVAVQPSGFVFCPPFFGCFPGGDFTTTALSENSALMLASARLDPTTLNVAEFQAVRGGPTVNVPVTSGTTAVGTIVGSPAVFNANEIFNSGVAFDPAGVGMTTLTVGVPAGFQTPSAGRQITATVTGASLSFSGSTTVGRDLQVPVSVFVDAPPPSTTTVTVSVPGVSTASVSTDATAAGGSTVTFTLEPGNTFVGTVYVQGRGLGDTTLTAQASGYGNGSVPVAVQPSGFVFCGSSCGQGDFTTTSFSGNTTLLVGSAVLDPTFLTFSFFQPVRGGRTVSVPVASGTTSVGTIVGPAVFNANDNFIGVEFDPAGLGMTTLTVGVPAGFETPSNGQQITATVTAATLFFNLAPVVGRDLQVGVSVSVDVPPPSARTVTVSVPSGATSIATVATDPAVAGGSTATFTLEPGNSSVGTVYVQGRGLGDTTLTAQAAGYSSGSVPVAVQPSGFVFPVGDFTTTSFSGNSTLPIWSARLDPVTLNYADAQAVRGGRTVSVPVASGTTSVGTIVGPAVFNANDFQSFVEFDPAGVGTTTLTVGVPTDFDMPSNLRQITATVTAPSLGFSFAPVVGRDLQVGVGVFVDVPPPSARTVTVSVPSGATSIATVATDPAVAGGSTATFTLEPGNTFVGTVYVQGRGVGDTTLTAQATGYTSASVPVAVQPSGFVFGSADFTTTSSSGNTGLAVYSGRLDPTTLNLAEVQGVRGGRTAVSVQVTSGTTAVGTIVGSPVVFNSNEFQTFPEFNPASVGMTTLTVGVPMGFDTPPTSSRQITATVVE